MTTGMKLFGRILAAIAVYRIAMTSLPFDGLRAYDGSGSDPRIVGGLLLVIFCLCATLHLAEERRARQLQQDSEADG